MVDILTKAGRFFGIDNDEGALIAAQIATGNFGGAAGTFVGSLGGLPDRNAPTGTVEGSTTPAGVDSPATLTQVSQTSSRPGGFRGSGMDTLPNQAFIGGAGLGSLLTQGAGQVGRILSRPGVGGLVGGLGAGAVVDFFFDEFGREKKLVITRKMQRDVKKLFMMSGGDFNTTAELYRMATGRSITGEQVVKIITKTFTNQGPFVTKAAVRKTRATIRKMETLCDLKDRLCPPKRAATRRRAPARSTTITNVR